MGNTLLNKDANGTSLQLFLPKEVRNITNPTTLTQEDGLGVMFAGDATFYIGSASSATFTLPADCPIAIPEEGMTVSTVTEALIM